MKKFCCILSVSFTHSRRGEPNPRVEENIVNFLHLGQSSYLLPPVQSPAALRLQNQLNPDGSRQNIKSNWLHKSKGSTSMDSPVAKLSTIRSVVYHPMASVLKKPVSFAVRAVLQRPFSFGVSRRDVGISFSGLY
jgi:hypothetical protein